MHTTTEIKRQSERIEQLIRKLETSADPASLATARDLVQSVMELYAAGLERVTEILQRKGEAGALILEELGHDELVGNLLAANGLHPQDFEVRVRQAVERLRERLGSHSGIDIAAIEEGRIRLRVRSGGSGCGSSSNSLKSLVEEAMYEAAPDLTEITIEGVEDQGAAGGFVPLEKLMGSTPASTNGKGAHR